MSSALSEIQTVALNAIASTASVEVERLTADVDLFELGLDSLDFWAILVDIEDSAGIEVSAEVLDQLAQFESRLTVGDVLETFAAWESAAGPDDGRSLRSSGTC